MGKRTIYLVRHGQQRAAPPPRDKFGNPLTPLGVRQARLTARRLAHLPVATIYYSTFHRAAETAEIIAAVFADARSRSSRGLWECIPYVPGTRAEVFADLKPEDRAWGARHAERAFERHFKPSRADRTEVLVCHGNLIRYLVCRVMGVDPGTWLALGTYNCGVSEVFVRPDGGAHLVSYNDVGHLPPRLQTMM